MLEGLFFAATLFFSIADKDFSIGTFFELVGAAFAMVITWLYMN